ncbi:MAG: dihydropteroate synthase [Candidatus Omnitrophica bacterium]|nr:dihydropteroate synthase [Candidatus Omnitrophota bacterium]
MLLNKFKKSTVPTIKKRPHFIIHAKSHKLHLGERTLLMGILNLTPDSFSHDGRIAKTSEDIEAIVKQAEAMVSDGADILDIGGESSRPGSIQISDAEEMDRIIPVIKHLTKRISIPISVDTYKPTVAKEALAAGAAIINTIKGIELDPLLLALVKENNAALVLMHMKGLPETMQNSIEYKKNLIEEIKSLLQKSIEKCMDFGINSDKIMIDPGIGFGKTTEHNLTIINHLDEFQSLPYPLLIGPSRKSFIGNIINRDVTQRLFGTIASISACVLRGAHIIRAHDIKAVKDALLTVDAIINEKINNNILNT